MSYSIRHTFTGAQHPNWYFLERWDEAHRERAIQRARYYVQDHGGYICVKDHAGRVVFGTDPIALDRAIASGTNRDFRRTFAETRQ